MIGATETALLDTVRGLFGRTLKQVATHPGTLSDIAIKPIVLTAPSVHVAWLGCDEGRTRREVESRWAFYVAADMLNGREKDRLGIYQIIERLAAGINGRTFGPTTGMKLTKGQHLYTDVQDANSVVLYELYFSGIMPLPSEVDEANLDDFERHWQIWAYPDGTPEFAAHINVNEQAND